MGEVTLPYAEGLTYNQFRIEMKTDQINKSQDLYFDTETNALNYVVTAGQPYITKTDGFLPQEFTDADFEGADTCSRVHAFLKEV